tara:strand:+ start:2013 stop:2951 length:939 start_codon:yes stop_codon:yes gene_type:complete
LIYNDLNFIFREFLLYKKLIKKNLCYLPFFNNWITKRSINIHKKKLGFIEQKLINSGLNLVSPKDFNYVNPSDYSHCNIWGSGYSAAESSLNQKLSSDSFDIGFGYSYLLNKDFNFYFIENAAPGFSELVNYQKKGLKKMVNLKSCKLIFKNIWQEKNDINYAINEYKNLALFSKDIVIPHYLSNKRIYMNAVDYILEKDDIFFRQACSTIVFSIAFAKYLGFKKIVIHGVDFGGKYFFDLPEYEHVSEFKPNFKNSEIYNEKWRKSSSRHPSGNCLELFLPLIKEKLNFLNIDLYSASRNSPLKNILPLYE